MTWREVAVPSWLGIMPLWNGAPFTVIDPSRRPMTDEPPDLSVLALETVTEQLLLAEVKRLRAQLAEAWDEGHDAGIDYVYHDYRPNPYRPQPKETP